MSKLQSSEFEKLQNNLRVGKCPNCGFDGDKSVLPDDGVILSLKESGQLDPNELKSFGVVLVTCPQCGFVSLFKRSKVIR